MAELAGAIGLQGRLRGDTTKSFLNDAIRIGEIQKRDRAAQQALVQKEKKGLDDLIGGSIGVDYNKIHPFNRDNALQATKDFVSKSYETSRSGDPQARVSITNRGSDLEKYIADLGAASKNLYAFENYANSGGYLNEEDQKFMAYVRTKNPKYIENLDLTKTAAIKAFDPETGDVVFTPFKRVDIKNAGIKKYFKPKERDIGDSGRFDIIGEVYDPQEVKASAMADFAAMQEDDPYYQNALVMFKKQALENLQKKVNPITGEKMYENIDSYSMKDPSFLEDLDAEIAELYGNYFAEMTLPKKEKLRAKPKSGSRSSSKTTNYGSTLTDFGWEQGSDGYYNDGTGERKYTSTWKGSTQPVSMNLSGSQDLFRASDGTFENKTGIQSYETGQPEITPVYTEGINKGKPVPDDRLELDKGKYKYQALINLSQTTKTGSGVTAETVVTPYLAPLSKVKTAYLLKLDKSEKEATQAQFSVMDKEIERLNRELKNSTTTKIPTTNNADPFRKEFNNANNKKAPRPR